MNTTALDLSKHAPRSPSERIANCVILARAIDKCRSDLAGTIGEFHTNCPLDRYLFDWKGTDYAAFRQLVAEGAGDEAIAAFVTETGTPKTAEEIAAWSDGMEAFRPIGSAWPAEKQEWFASECVRVGIDPAQSTMFQYLIEDDRQSFAP